MEMEQTIGKRYAGTASIGWRLALSFSVMLLLMMLMAAIGGWQLDALSKITTRIAAVDARAERVVGDWLAETKSNAVRALVLTRSDDADLRRLLTPQLEATTKRISELQKQVESMGQTAEAKALFADVGAKRKTYVDARSAALEQKKAGRV